MDTLGKRLKHLRFNKELSILVLKDELSSRLNMSISATSISNIENDKQDPNTLTLIALSDYYDVSIDWLLRGKEFNEVSRVGKVSTDNLETKLGFVNLQNNLMDYLNVKTDDLSDDELMEKINRDMTFFTGKAQDLAESSKILITIINEQTRLLEDMNKRKKSKKN